MAWQPRAKIGGTEITHGPGTLDKGMLKGLPGYGKKFGPGKPGKTDFDMLDIKKQKLLKAPGEVDAPDLAPAYTAQKYNNPNDELQNNALNRRFDILRGKTEGAANENAQNQNDALQRALAAHGRLGSGSGQKQSMLLNKSLDQAKTNAVNDVESQREVGQADLANQKAQREYEFNQAEANKVYQSQESRNQQASDNAFRYTQFNAQNKQFTQQMNQAIRQYNLDQNVTRFNQQIAAKMANKVNLEDTIGTHSIGYGTYKYFGGKGPNNPATGE